MLPLKDDNPKNIPPIVTVGIIVGCVLIFLWQASLHHHLERQAVLALGAIPAVLFQFQNLPSDIAILPPTLDILTLISSIFLHGGWFHLLGNMLYLWIFGDNVEDAMGHGRFILFYLICGILAGLINAAAAPFSTVPTVGASGAIAGVLGAYLVLYPRARVLVWAFAFFVFRLPAWLVLGLWFVMQVAMSGNEGSNVAWWAHIGGMVAGATLIPLFKYGHVGLFGAGHRSQTRQPIKH